MVSQAASLLSFGFLLSEWLQWPVPLSLPALLRPFAALSRKLCSFDKDRSKVSVCLSVCVCVRVYVCRGVLGATLRRPLLPYGPWGLNSGCQALADSVGPVVAHPPSLVFHCFCLAGDWTLGCRPGQCWTIGESSVCVGGVWARASGHAGGERTDNLWSPSSSPSCRLPSLSGTELVCQPCTAASSLAEPSCRPQLIYFEFSYFCLPFSTS